jgi:hypothetical protein
MTNELNLFFISSVFPLGKLYLIRALKCLLGLRSISGGFIGVDGTLSNSLLLRPWGVPRQSSSQIVGMVSIVSL